MVMTAHPRRSTVPAAAVQFHMPRPRPSRRGVPPPVLDRAVPPAHMSHPDRTGDHSTLAFGSTAARPPPASSPAADGAARAPRTRRRTSLTVGPIRPAAPGRRRQSLAELPDERLGEGNRRGIAPPHRRRPAREGPLERDREEGGGYVAPAGSAGCLPTQLLQGSTGGPTARRKQIRRRQRTERRAPAAARRRRRSGLLSAPSSYNRPRSQQAAPG